MLVQMVHVLQTPVLQRSAHRDVIKKRQMLNVLTEADASRVRANRNSELCGHQQHREHLVHASKPATIDLTNSQRVRLQKLFEHDSVVTVFPGSNRDGGDRSGDCCMPKNVVGICRFFNPMRIEHG